MRLIYMVANWYESSLSLQNVSAPEGVQHNEFEKIIAKLDNYFVPLIYLDSARSKFAEMVQRSDESSAQYYVRLRIQAAKCGFMEANAVIRSTILQTMTDARLR